MIGVIEHVGMKDLRNILLNYHMALDALADMPDKHGVVPWYKSEAARERARIADWIEALEMYTAPQFEAIR